jgi:hypothetical protein
MQIKLITIMVVVSGDDDDGGGGNNNNNVRPCSYYKQRTQKQLHAWPPASTDSVSAFSVIRDSPRPEKNNWKIKEINGSKVPKRAPSENG